MVRRIFDEWGRGDFRGAAALFDPYVLLVLHPEFPDPGTYLGPEAIANYTRDLLAAWEDFSIVAEDFVDAGDTVVVEVRQRGVGRSSGVVTELRYVQVFTFRGDAIIRIESFAERDQALEAVGLRE